MPSWVVSATLKAQIRSDQVGRDILPNTIPLFQGRGMSRGADLGLCGAHGSCPQTHGRPGGLPAFSGLWLAVLNTFHIASSSSRTSRRRTSRCRTSRGGNRKEHLARPPSVVLRKHTSREVRWLRGARAGRARTRAHPPDASQDTPSSNGRLYSPRTAGERDLIEHIYTQGRARSAENLVTDSMRFVISLFCRVVLAESLAPPSGSSVHCAASSRPMSAVSSSTTQW